MEIRPPRPSQISMTAACALIGPAFKDIIAERVEQIDVHGFTPEHDAGHQPQMLAWAAFGYLNEAIEQLRHPLPNGGRPPLSWPWEAESWKPGDTRASLVKAAAIIWATIDRIDAGQPLELTEVAP